MMATALDADVCYRALLTRDPRFDGRFFVGVRTTGIYCRPICGAPAPRAANCRFFVSAPAAQEAGFRPCLRCRPEASPGTPAWAGTSATVSRALRLIATGLLDTGSVADLAQRLGIGERHLSRLFRRHLGASPLAVAQTRRILAAKRLLTDTDLPITEVALASGFGSLRRFNAVVRATWRRSPRELRGRRQRPEREEGGPGIVLRLGFRPPFAWNAIIDFLAARAVPGIEQATPAGYRRAIRLGGAAGMVEVRPVSDEPFLEVRIVLDRSEPLLRVAERVRHVFDLDADPRAIARLFRSDRVLGARLARLPGIRVPGAWSGFELAVRAIVGQQVSVRGATTLLGRLVERHGDVLPPHAVPSAAGLTRLFPTPEALAAADLTALGLTRARAGAVAALARAVAEGSIDLDVPAASSETLARLRALPGVGEWTIEYIAMRALREPDAFLASDLGVRRALRSGAADLPFRAIARLAERWRPLRAYAVMLLWSVPETRDRSVVPSGSARRSATREGERIESHSDERASDTRRRAAASTRR